MRVHGIEGVASIVGSILQHIRLSIACSVYVEELLSLVDS